MDIGKLDIEQCREWRRKRHAFFSNLVKEYTSFEDFMRCREEKLFMYGVQLTQEDYYIRLYIQFDYSEYEEFHIIMGEDGHLTLSNGVGFEECFANMIQDIVTEEYLIDYPEEE